MDPCSAFLLLPGLPCSLSSSPSSCLSSPLPVGFVTQAPSSSRIFGPTFFSQFASFPLANNPPLQVLTRKKMLNEASNFPCLNDRRRPRANRAPRRPAPKPAPTKTNRPPKAQLDNPRPTRTTVFWRGCFDVLERAWIRARCYGHDVFFNRAPAQRAALTSDVRG